MDKNGWLEEEDPAAAEKEVQLFQHCRVKRNGVLQPREFMEGKQHNQVIHIYKTNFNHF